MSCASGEVLEPGTLKVLAHFVYNGTVDMAMPQIFATAAERNEVWRGANKCKCDCGFMAGAVILLAHYGPCLSWKAIACLNCMVITDGRDPHRRLDCDRPLRHEPRQMFFGYDDDYASPDRGCLTGTCP